MFVHDVGALALNNFGTVKGQILADVAGAGDRIINHGKIAGGVFLGPGEDTYIGKGVGFVTGAIHGGADNDDFVAGPAKETFFGDAGSDHFGFASILDSPAGAKHDTFADFSHAQGDRDHPQQSRRRHRAPHQQAFVFIGGQTFAHYHSTHPGVIGMLRFDAAHHLLQGNVNADFASADFEVNLPGVTVFHANDSETFFDAAYATSGHDEKVRSGEREVRREGREVMHAAGSAAVRVVSAASPFSGL